MMMQRMKKCLRMMATSKTRITAAGVYVLKTLERLKELLQSARVQADAGADCLLGVNPIDSDQ